VANRSKYNKRDGSEGIPVALMVFGVGGIAGNRLARLAR
jgi:hypothetical protein